MALPENDVKLSRDLVTMVQILFAVVLGNGLVTYSKLITHPFNPSHRTAVIALIGVYLTTIWSWVDWHQTAEKYPYLVRSGSKSLAILEELRILPDLIIVAIYAYLLLTIEAFQIQPSASILRHLVGYPAVFAVYLIAGYWRRYTFGPVASKISAIWIALGVFSLVTMAYVKYSSPPTALLNVRMLLLTIALTLGYRFWLRPLVNSGYRSRKMSGPVIGVDIDGTLADQITGIIAYSRDRYGIRFEHDDVKDWHYMIGGEHDIADVINDRLADSSYTLEMPVNKGARILLNDLSLRSTVKLVTGRDAEHEGRTESWLTDNRLPYDALLHVDKERHVLEGFNILVDDYMNNIAFFLKNTDGRAFLVDQPWNQDRSGVDEYIRSGRLVVVQTLGEIAGKIA